MNPEGEVIGINSAIYSRSGGNMALRHPQQHHPEDCPPAREAREGHPGLALAVYIQKVTHDMAGALGLKAPEGALIAQVVDDGPAAKAGVKSATRSSTGTASR